MIESSKYTNTADELVQRIIALIPAHPEIVEMIEPWGLFKCGLECSDLEPTLAQATWALGIAQSRWKASHD